MSRLDKQAFVRAEGSERGSRALCSLRALLSATLVSSRALRKPDGLLACRSKSARRDDLRVSTNESASTSSSSPSLPRSARSDPDLPIELVDVLDALLAVVVLLDDRAVPAEDKVARRRAVVGPLGRLLDCERELGLVSGELEGKEKRRERDALPWLLGVPSWMNETHCDMTSLDSSASPGRVPSVLAVLYGTPNT